MSEITFSFGKNWCDYIESLTEAEIDAAKANIHEWIPADQIEGKTVVDIGSGSGLHSLSFYRSGAASVLSLDVDPHSVKATTALWEKEGKPENWNVGEGSVLNKEYVAELGQFDIVYSWGVLHHTGDMWNAIHNASTLVKPGGGFWISIYQKGPNYGRDLELKQAFNAASNSGKKWMMRKWMAREMARRAKRFKNPFGWFEKTSRGMNSYHDMIDWLGGLPYEVADVNEIMGFLRERQFVMEKVGIVNEGGCSNYMLTHVPGLPPIGKAGEKSK